MLSLPCLDMQTNIDIMGSTLYQLAGEGLVMLYVKVQLLQKYV